MGRTEEGKKAKYLYDLEYAKTHTKSYCCRLNLEKDKDIIKAIEQQGSFVGYMKKLIRNDIKKNHKG